MKLITEVVEKLRYFTEAKENGSKSLYIEGVFLQANIKNKNNRFYPMSVMENEVNRYTEAYIKKGRALGELGHPEGPSINLDRAAILTTSLVRESNNFIGKAKVLDTPMGNIVKSLLDADCGIGVSSRGMGSLKLNSEGVNEVQNDFYLSTAADVVADPSAPDAFVNGIMEGKEFWFQDGRWIAAEQAQQTVNKLAKTKSLNEEALMRVFQKYISSL